MLLAFGVHGAAAVHAQPVDAPPALQAAIQSYVEGEGNAFAGDCREAQTGEFAGQYCYTVVDLTNAQADVRVGQALSDETILLTFENVNGTWQLDDGRPTATATATGPATPTTMASATPTATRTATATVSPSPPKTGNGGLVPVGGALPLVALLAAAAVGVIVAGRSVTNRHG
jgi:hypothetical protein